MGEYKDKNKTTRLGDFVRKIGRSDLIEKAISLAGGTAVGGFVGILKDLVSSDPKVFVEDKEIALKEADLDIAEMQAITNRWESDSNSDSQLAKNIRPITLASLLLFMYLSIILDSLNIGFSIAEHWAQTLTTLLLTVIGAYFGARTIDKITKTIKGK